jgi:3-oxocholest-4-en-26-oyl-CoA dehydrogenase beta subunit
MATVVELLGTSALPTPIFASAIDAMVLLGQGTTSNELDAMLSALESGREIIVVAVHEQDSAPPAVLSDVHTTADALGEDWRLQGTKLYVPYLNSARRFLCVARIDASTIATFVVPCDAPGVKTVRLSTSNNEPLYAIELDGVVLPHDAQVAVGAEAWARVEAMIDIGAALKSAELLGIGRRALQLTVDYVRVREQFGRPIGAFQAVQHHVVEMFRLIEQTRILVEQSIAFLDNGLPATREVSLAKIKASEGIYSVLNLAHQLHGGVGYYTDYPLETYFRRMMAAQGAYGSAHWHRQRLSKLLLKDPDAFRRSGAHSLVHP